MQGMSVFLSTGVLFFACAAQVCAQVGPPFRGPEIHEGAWVNTHDWSELVDGDPSKGSYAWAYRSWALERADRHADDRTRLDCADLSIHMICEYAASNGLPLVWRVYYPAERRFVTFRNTDRQFASADAFQEWSMWYLGAMNLADNTDAITYDEWAGGDMLLMDWNQTDEEPNFGDREVWHTYLIGKPDEVIYYGNITGSDPLPVTRVTGGSRMDMVRTHPDRYRGAPSRFRLFRGAVTPPVEAQEAEVVRATRLNLRAGPGTDQPIVTRADRGSRFRVLGQDGRWVKLLLPDGREAWGHGYYLSLQEAAGAGGLVDGVASAR